ncbi:hypothetical protein Huta_1030 [Halorhabdus utahensis DSM 12940]|uniref:Uncharacterized protein n=1 Tax=Halorhabdus utahensis (strain DSM 12940 / JCM 11049 / AX-2) TaxID=519442 RepID=C7NVC9_HALUD|nr:hypothetical protein [Halorhabdus utahensis]ACV11213.1 hypothetical protein Huta_1030 [Halorhabdus utahensis DSM 12940]
MHPSGLRETLSGQPVGFQINDSEMRNWEQARGIPADADQHPDVENSVKVVAQCFQGTDIPNRQDAEIVSNTTATVELGDGEPTRVVTEIPERNGLSRENKSRFKCLYGFAQNTGIDLLPVHNSWRGTNAAGWSDDVPLQGTIIEGIPAESPTDYGGLINFNPGTPLNTEENELDQYTSSTNTDIFTDFPAETGGLNPIRRNPRVFCKTFTDSC